MEAKVHARLAQFSAQSEIPVATKAFGAGFAKGCWDELTQYVILSAWDIDEADGNDDKKNNNDDSVVIEVECGHSDLEEADLIITTRAAERDDGDDDDE
jgi:hypothetical protein